MMHKKTPLPQATIDAINMAARAVAVHAPTFGQGEGKAYEAWVLMEIAAEIGSKYGVSAMDHAGKPTMVFRVSRGPSNLPVATSKKLDQPCHFLVGDNFELHSGLRHKGVSGDAHEIDISMIWRPHAESIRQGKKAAPYEGYTSFGVELKEYNPAGWLPKTYARALLGVACDLTPHQMLGPVIIHYPRSSHFRWTDPTHETKYILVTTAKLRKPSKDLLEHYRIGQIELAAVASGAACIEDIVNSTGW
jgi:hypothetical protein